MVYIKHLYGVSSASTTDLAHVDILAGASVLFLIEWSIDNATSNAGDRIVGEISTASASVFATNDAQGIISTCSMTYAMTTSGSAVNAVNKVISPISYPIPSGTRLFLHTVQVGTTATRFSINLHLATSNR